MTLFEVKLKYQTRGGIMAWSDSASHGWLDNVKRVTITQDRGAGVIMPQIQKPSTNAR
jgi:hypothetical protein